MMQSRSGRASRFISFALVLLFAAAATGCSVGREIADVVSAPFERGPGRQGPSLPMTVVVAPFTGTMSQYTNRSVELGQEVAKALDANPKVTLGDFQRLDAESRSLASPGETTLSRLFKAARQTGVNTLITGAIVDLSVRRHLKGVYGFRENNAFLGLEAQLTIFDLANGIVVGETSIRREVGIDEVKALGIEQGQEPPKDLVDQLQGELSTACVEWVNETIPEQEWTGFIISADGDRIVMTGGTNNGFTAGSIVHAYAPGEPIKTGAGLTVYLLGAKVGTLKIVEPGKSTSVAQVESKVEGEKKDIVFRTGMMLKAF